MNQTTNMKKEYIVDVSQYPKSYSIVAETKEEAIMKAKEMFYSETGGASIWTVDAQEN